MEFLVEFEVEIPTGTPQAEVEQRQRAESAAAAELVQDGISFGSGDGRSWETEQLRSGCTALTARPSWTIYSVPCLLPTGCGSRSRRSRHTQTIRGRPLDE